jgi:hypothetical protein
LALIFIISLHLLALDFVCSCFSRCLRCSIREVIYLSSSVLLIYALRAINVPLRTAFSVSLTF